MIIPTFEDSPWWWQPFALLWKKRAFIPVDADVVRISAELNDAQQRKMSKFKSAVDNLGAWLETVRLHPDTTDANDVFILNTIPVTLLVDVDLKMYEDARSVLATRYPTGVTDDATVQVQTGDRLFAVDLAPAEVPPEMVPEPTPHELMPWPQVSFDSPTYTFRQQMVQLIARHGSDALKQAFQALKAQFPKQYEGNLAVAACYMTSNPELGELGLKSYLHTTPSALLDMDALLAIGPLLSCAS